MPDFIHVEIVGIEKLRAALKKFPEETERDIGAAGEQASEIILKTKGIDYPPPTAANMPPTPYYIRGRGTQYASRNKGESERLGTQWTVKSKGMQTEIANRASYAHWVVGEDQARAMGRIGWRKLVDVAQEKTEAITKIYQAWTDRLLQRIGLK